jgi:TolB-like protein/Tfp pilus assembly protein PilF
MERAEQRDEPEKALAAGLKLLSLDLLQEHVHRALMRIYAAQGRSDAALAQYDKCRGELVSQLGVRPEPETEKLARSIRASRRDAPAEARESRWTAAPADKKLALPSRPSIAVLPFALIGSDEDSRYFAEGITDDIITELSRNRDLFVIARHSSFNLPAEKHDPATVGEVLGVSYLLTGSVRRASDRLRLSVHLIQCETGIEAWAERYDRRLAGLFDVQLDVARTVTATIAGRLADLAGAVSATKPPDNFDAYDHVLRAQHFLQKYTRADNDRAREHLKAAIRIDPSYPRPYGLMCIAGVQDSFWEMSEDGLAEVLALGVKALALDDQDAKTHLALAVAHLFSHHHERAVHHIERAIALNPNEDQIAVEHARILLAIGEPVRALSRVREAMRLNPYHPNWYWNVEGLCLHRLGRYEEAISAYGRIDQPQFWTEAYLAACHAMCGRDELAREHRGRLFATRPDFSLTAFRVGLPVRSDVELEHFLATFRRAGIPD